MSKRVRKDLAVVILAAGKGRRMLSERPKVMFDLAGWPLVRHVVETARELRPGRILVVTGHGRQEVEGALLECGVEFVRQRGQKGTGHAVRSAGRALAGHDGTVLVLFGDVPLVSPSVLSGLLRTHGRRRSAVTVLTTEVLDATGYGRVLRDGKGRFSCIREEKDATAAERSVREINSGIMAFRSTALWPALRRLKADNAQGELYLTDVPGALLAREERVETFAAPIADEVLGVNSLADLAKTAARARDGILAAHMERGVRIVDPATTWIDRRVEIGRGTTVFPFSVITGEVSIGRDCEVGPFSHLRHGTHLADGAQIGNFVEVKNSEVGAEVRAKHLSYLGDASIGRETNVGCGTITANYDGIRKHRTIVGRNVSLGSGTVLVAPVEVGDRAVTGAGAIVLAGQEVKDGERVAGVPATPIDTRGDA